MKEEFNLSDKIISYYEFDYLTDDTELLEVQNVEKAIKEIFAFTEFLEKKKQPCKYEHLKCRLKLIFGKELITGRIINKCSLGHSKRFSCPECQQDIKNAHKIGELTGKIRALLSDEDRKKISAHINAVLNKELKDNFNKMNNREDDMISYDNINFVIDSTLDKKDFFIKDIKGEYCSCKGLEPRDSFSVDNGICVNCSKVVNDIKGEEK